MIYKCNSRGCTVHASILMKMSQKRKKIVVSVQQKWKRCKDWIKVKFFALSRPIMELKRKPWEIGAGIALIWHDSRVTHVVQRKIARLWISRMIKLTLLYSLFLMWLFMCDCHGLVIIGFCVDMFIYLKV